MALVNFDGVFNLVNTVVGRIWPDKTEQEKAVFKAALQQSTQDFQLALGQIEINKEEARSGHMFNSAWRPFCGWVCATALAWEYLLQPIITYIYVLCDNVAPQLPLFNIGELMPLLFGLLGLGAMRSFEKSKGVAAK